MAEERLIFNQINLVVRDMADMVRFYEHLGVTFRATLPAWEGHHRTFGNEVVLAGFDFDLDSQAFVTQWNAGWPRGLTGAVLGFQFPSARSVDETYDQLTEAGYTGQQAPWDGFMGARYAVVADPDGNSVGLMGPIDRAHSTIPPLPEEREQPAVGATPEVAPEDIGFPAGSADDKELLLQWLGYLRRAVLRKTEGLTDEQARWTPNGRLIPLVGILNHLTRVEWRWIDGGFAGAEVSREDQEFRPAASLSLSEAVAAYQERAHRTDAAVQSIPLTQPGSGWAAGHDLRFVLLHLINETARHAGHADATREMLDGITGE